MGGGGGGGGGGAKWTEKAFPATGKESKAVFWPAPCLKETSLDNSYSLQKGPKCLCPWYKSFFLHFKNIAYTHYRSCSPCQSFVDCGNTKNKPHALKTYERSESASDQKPVLYKKNQSITQSSYHKRGSWILQQCAHSSEPTVSHSAVATWSENTKQNSAMFVKAVTSSHKHHWKSDECVAPADAKSSSWLSVIYINYNNDDNQSSSLYPHFSSMLMLKMEWRRPILDFSGYHRLVLVIHHLHWHTEGNRPLRSCTALHLVLVMHHRRWHTETTDQLGSCTAPHLVLVMHHRRWYRETTDQLGSCTALHLAFAIQPPPPPPPNPPPTITD